MKLQKVIEEAVAKNTRFIKRKRWDNWIELKDGHLYWNSSSIKVNLTLEDILANDWQTSVAWYETEDFKKRFPNGILCLVSDNNSDNEFFWHCDIIINYDKSIKRFVNVYDEYFHYIKPIPPDKIPITLTKNYIINNCKTLIK